MGATLTLEPGEVVGITGASGCGKSTLGLLLQKLYPLNGGRISVAGTDLNTLDTKWWRSQVAVVTQDPMLFSGSIGQNISYGRPQATQDEIEFAAKAAWAHEFILAMPQGYNTPLGERGVSLSGGQKQRIAIARAILATPQILILDEATSALDREHEQKVRTGKTCLLKSDVVVIQVQASLKALMKQCTCLVISHHPFILQETNRVIVLDQGRVVQDGPFHVLAQDTEGVLLSLLRYEEDD
jgi:ABC-type multidrug transport system fused ATPase/permease subunit